MEQLWWYASRATGIVATALIVGALVWGFFFSARNTGARRSPAWWLDLHNWLGGSALVMIGLHLVAVYLDSNSGVGLVGLVVPGATRWALTWGVIATYLLAAAVMTSWPRKQLRPKLWRTIHLGSVIGAGLAGVHAYQAGSDASGRPLQIALVLGGAAGVYALGVRVLGLGLRSRTSVSQRGHRSDQRGPKP